MTTTLIAPVPVTGWGDSDERWLEARRNGVSASDVAAVLGFSEYATPWEVWAEKTGFRPREVDASKEAIRLGNGLEPWLLAQARHLLDCDNVVRTPARLYAHPDAPWRLASPDGFALLAGTPGFGIEAKTAGLATGFGVPEGWTDKRAPLGYQFQVRWQMHVMNWERVDLVALVAGLGLRTYTYTRDLAIESDMVAQVEEWHQRHIVGKVEPAMSPRDNALMDSTFPDTDGGEIRLDDDPEIVELLYAYADGLSRETAGKAQKEAATAALKRKLGSHAVGTVAGRPVVTWNTKRSDVRWRDFLTDLYEVGGWDADDIEDDVESYRGAPARSISVKGLGS
jgi:putative phage-type endonuclease